MSAFDSFDTPGTDAHPWNAHDYAIDAGFVPVLGGAVARLLDPQRGERILDLGCGDGVLSFDLALSGAHITGVDASPELVGGARARGIEAHVMDAHAMTFDRQFDAVFSNAALHWMRGADQVIAGVARALKPGGRFVAEMGGHGNVVAITSALQAALCSNGHAVPAFPWYFPPPTTMPIAARARLPGALHRVAGASDRTAHRHARLAADLRPSVPGRPGRHAAPARHRRGGRAARTDPVRRARPVDRRLRAAALRRAPAHCLIHL